MPKARGQVTGPDPIKGTAQSDYIHISGLKNDDMVPDASWDHSVYGYGGNDFFRFNPIIDWSFMSTRFDRSIYFNGGSGTDHVSLQDSHHPITINLAGGTGMVHIPPVSWWTPEDGWQNSEMAIEMTFYSVENATGGAGDDHIIGDGNANHLSGAAGNDTLLGGGGDDTLLGGDQNDSLEGGDGNDTLNGGNHDDFLSGDDGHDNMEGGHGNDSIWGGEGQDTLEGGVGDDELYGGDGFDFAIFDTNGDMTVDLQGGIAWGGGLGIDVLHSIERVVTGDGDDEVIGTDEANIMWMGAGDDTVYGFGGIDNIKGHAGDDLLLAGNGNDSVYGGEGHDRVYGENGKDMLSGGDGNDTMNGGGGNDQMYGGDGNDRLLGDFGNDTLEGDDGHDFIDAGVGDDMIVGGSGNDTIHAGAGDDTIHTGSGLDVIHYDNTPGVGIDTIYDLNIWGDEFAFESGFFYDFDKPVDNLNYLVAVQTGQDSLLFATRSFATLPDGVAGDAVLVPDVQAIAIIKDVNAALLNQQIANGDIFHTEVGVKQPDLSWEFELPVVEVPVIAEEWSMV